jgi:RNA polymerase sigma-70 factor (ECF subfamily)
VVSDEELMLAYQKGDAAAFRELFERYTPQLTRILQRDIGSADDVRDLVQQTFLQLHRARHDFRTDRKLRPYLITIALNLKRQHLRTLARRPRMTDLDSVQPAAQTRSAESRDNAHKLREALAALPAAQRDAIVLHWFEGFSFAEVAEILGIKLSAVKVRAHRGYQRLRERLGDVTEFGARHTSGEPDASQ